MQFRPFSLGVLVLLASCGTVAAPFSGDGYTLRVPAGWSFDDTKTGYTSTTIGAFLRNDAQGGKYVLAIQNHKLPTASTTTASFNRLIIDNSERTAGYSEKSREEVTVDGQETTILTYRLGTRADDPTFIETSIVRDGSAYVLLATLPAAPNDAIAKQAQEAILSFTPVATAPSTAPSLPSS